MEFLKDEEKMNRSLVQIPIRIILETKGIAQAFTFLGSDESSFVTGSSFVVDRGITECHVTPL